MEKQFTLAELRLADWRRNNELKAIDLVTSVHVGHRGRVVQLANLAKEDTSQTCGNSSSLRLKLFHLQFM